MRGNFGTKPFLYPQPVLMVAIYGEDGIPGIMSAAWGGVANMERVTMYLNANRETMENVLIRKAFMVSMADANHVTECGYLDIVLANQVPDKVARAGFHMTKSAHVDAPLVDELPLALECRFASFNKGSELLVGEIVNASADEHTLNASDTINPARLRPITLDTANSAYLVLGEKVGNAFRDGERLK